MVGGGQVCVNADLKGCPLGFVIRRRYLCVREKERERELLECSRVDEVLLEKKSEDRSPDEVLEKIYR